MHLETVLGLIAERETAAQQAAEQLRAQMTALTDELTRIDGELADLATTRSTLHAIAAAEFTAENPTVISNAYQQILTILRTTSSGMRAKDICLALDVEPSPKHVEGTRAKLKRMVSRNILTENEPGIFALTPKQT
jgi:chorismate mutase